MAMFWMTWTAQGPLHWDQNKLQAMIRKFRSAGTVTEPWRIIRRDATKGDIAIAFKQGRGPRGIFGVGTILNAPCLRPELFTKPGQNHRVANVQFERLVDPMAGEMLVTLDALLKKGFPLPLINARASGFSVPEPWPARLLAEIDRALSLSRRNRRLAI